MIDRDELRIARRTAERNGYTVLPPREDDERDLDRFRQRQQEREEYRSSRPEYRRFRDEVDDEPVIRKPSFRDEKDAPKPRFRPLDTTDDADDDFDDNYVPAKKYTTRPVYREENDDDVDDYVPPRKPVRQEIDLEVARKAMEDAGYEVRKLSRLDMAKRVAQDAGFDVRKITPTDRTKPVDRNFVRKERPTPTVADDDEGNDRPVRRVATRDGEPIRRPVFNREAIRQNRDAIRTRTAPDTEVKPQTPPPPPQETQPKEPPVEPTPAPKAEPTKKPSFEDDYVNRAAAFFGDDE